MICVFDNHEFGVRRMPYPINSLTMDDEIIVETREESVDEVQGIIIKFTIFPFSMAVFTISLSPVSSPAASYLPSIC
jgi:hypothetical protein